MAFSNNSLSHPVGWSIGPLVKLLNFLLKSYLNCITYPAHSCDLFLFLFLFPSCNLFNKYSLALANKKKIDQFFERWAEKNCFHFSFGALRGSWGELRP